MSKQDAKAHVRARRNLLKSVMAAGGVIATDRLLPEQWTRPVVASVMLPAHAVSTPTCTLQTFSFSPSSTLDINTNNGSVYGTSPPVFGTINTVNGQFSVTGGTSVPCINGPGIYSITFTGTASGAFYGRQDIFCNGTEAGICTVDGAATNFVTAIVLNGTVSCTYCPDLISLARGP